MFDPPKITDRQRPDRLSPIKGWSPDRELSPRRSTNSVATRGSGGAVAGLVGSDGAAGGGSGGSARELHRPPDGPLSIPLFDRMFAVIKIVGYLLLGFLAIGVSGGCQTRKLCFSGNCPVGYVYAPTSCRCVPGMDASTDADTAADGISGHAEGGSSDDDGAATN